MKIAVVVADAVVGVVVAAMAAVVEGMVAAADTAAAVADAADTAAAAATAIAVDTECGAFACFSSQVDRVLAIPTFSSFASGEERRRFPGPS